MIEVINTVYANYFFDKILNGHVYFRAVRAHFMVNAVLAKIIFLKLEQTSKISQSDIESLRELINGVVNIISKQYFNDEKFTKILKSVWWISERSADRVPTVKLWIEYFKIATLIKPFLVRQYK